MTLLSPLQDPATWSYARVDATVPAGLDFAGDRLCAVRATRGSPGGVRSPGWAALRTDAAGTALQLQLLPFRLRPFTLRLPVGLPTFYYLFDAPGALTYSADSSQDEAAETDLLGTVFSVVIAVALADHAAREPSFAFRLISEAATGLGGDFAGFADAVAAALAQPPHAPLKLLDQALQPLNEGRVRFETAAGAVHTVDLVPADGGDLQRAVARRHAADPAAMPLASVWGGGAPVTVTPLASGAVADFRLVCLETGASAAGEIETSPQASHLSLVNLNAWFAPQRASTQLKRYSSGNRITYLANGKEFFSDLFARLDEAAAAGGGFHLSGWDMHPNTEFRDKPDGAPDTFALTLKQAVKNIHSGGGKSRFLPSEFYNFEDPDAVSRAEIVAASIILALPLFLYLVKTDLVRTNGSGALILLALIIANPILFPILMSDDGMFFEPNKPAKEQLDDPTTSSLCKLARYPATVDDNPLAAIADFPFDTLFPVIRRFGIFHQKLSVTKVGNDFTGYIGGVDLNPNRIDDADHLHPQPFHDVHAKLVGPAVRDLALTFHERWLRDGDGSVPAFNPPADSSEGPGNAFVQVARTYFAPAAPARALPFAPNGDRTLADTMLQAIRNASQFIFIEDQYLTPPKEYRDALIAKVANGEIRKLIIFVPSLNDQPFGEAPRTNFIAALRAADAGRGIVYVGTPRRRYTVPARELVSDYGMMRLMHPLDAIVGIPGSEVIALGPAVRVPPPPFWLSIDGELLYAYDEAPGGNLPGTQALLVERGSSTRIVSGQGAGEGATPRAHKSGAAATLVELANIYVHAKMMIVDDAFISLGSANLNRRGLYHDGEANIFVVPERLRTGLDNPIRSFRRRLWAEMADLPEPVGLPLMDDPIGSAALFKRSYFYGNRAVEPEAAPPHVMSGATTSDGVVFLVLQALVFATATLSHKKLFDSVADPTSLLDPLPGL